MFDFDPAEYKNFFYGITTRRILFEKKLFPFTLWGEDLILFWNDGEPVCYQNFCPHYGLPLDQGKLKNGHIECGFHGWQFDLSDGELTNAPLAQKQPTCCLKKYATLVRGGIVFIYPGNESGRESAEQKILQTVTPANASNSTVYPVPFYLAMNSSMDFPHHAFHTLFYSIYGLYRNILGRRNPLLTTYTPVPLEESEDYFKYRINETGVELTVHPFCTEYHDSQAKNIWQIFVRPIDNVSSQYLITIHSYSKNPLYRVIVYLVFRTIIRHVAMPEDVRWLGTSYKHWEKGINLNLCDHDYGMKQYLKKFMRTKKSPVSYEQP